MEEQDSLDYNSPEDIERIRALSDTGKVIEMKFTGNDGRIYISKGTIENFSLDEETDEFHFDFKSIVTTEIFHRGD